MRKSGNNRGECNSDTMEEDEARTRMSGGGTSDHNNSPLPLYALDQGAHYGM